MSKRKNTKEVVADKLDEVGVLTSDVTMYLIVTCPPESINDIIENIQTYGNIDEGVVHQPSVVSIDVYRKY